MRNLALAISILISINQAQACDGEGEEISIATSIEVIEVAHEQAPFDGSSCVANVRTISPTTEKQQEQVMTITPRKSCKKHSILSSKRL